MFLFCKTILYSGNCRIFRDLVFGSIKTRFKAILKKLDFSAQIACSAHIYFFHECLPPSGRPFYPFNELLPPDGDFSAQLYFFYELLPPEGDYSAHIYFFHELLPPEGDFSAHIYIFKWTFAPGGRLFCPPLCFCPYYKSIKLIIN